MKQFRLDKCPARPGLMQRSPDPGPDRRNYPRVGMTSACSLLPSQYLRLSAQPERTRGLSRPYRPRWRSGRHSTPTRREGEGTMGPYFTEAGPDDGILLYRDIDGPIEVFEDIDRTTPIGTAPASVGTPPARRSGSSWSTTRRWTAPGSWWTASCSRRGRTGRTSTDATAPRSRPTRRPGRRGTLGRRAAGWRGRWHDPDATSPTRQRVDPRANPAIHSLARRARRCNPTVRHCRTPETSADDGGPVRFNHAQVAA